MNTFELPGSDVMPDSPPVNIDVGATAAAVESTLAECAQVAESYNDRIKAVVAECLKTCVDVDGSCQTCVHESVSKLLESAGDVALKCQQTVMDAATNQLALASYKAKEAIGYVQPPLPQIVADLAAQTPPAIKGIPVHVGGPISGPPCVLINGVATCPDGSPAQNLAPPGQKPQYFCPGVGFCPEPAGVPGVRPEPAGGVLPPVPAPAPAATCPPPIINVNCSPCASDTVPTGGQLCPPGQVIDPATGECVTETKPPPPAPPPQDGGDGAGQPPPNTNLFYDWDRLKCPDFGVFALLNQASDVAPVLEQLTGFSFDGETRFWPGPLLNLMNAISAPALVRKGVWAVGHALLVDAPVLALGLAGHVGGCDYNAAGAKVAVLGVMGVIQRWVGCDLSFLTEKLKMDIAYSCPSDLPGQGEVNELHNKGLIDLDTWNCWTRANDNLPGPHGLAAEAARPIPTPQEAFRAENLKRVNPLTTDRMLERSGWDVGLWRDLINSSFWGSPPIGQTMNTMAGQLTDEQFVQRWGLDGGFNDARTDRAKQFLYADGCDDEYQHVLWRLHWRMPSAGQVIEMMKRFRKDHPDPQIAQLALNVGEIEQLLAASGVPRSMYNYLINLSYKRIGRGDINRAYANKVIDRHGAIAGYQDLGFHQADAETLVAIQDELNAKKETPKPVLVTVRSILANYVDGIISESEARQELATVVTDADQVETYIAEGRTGRLWKLRRKSIAAVRHRYQTGDLSLNGVAVALLSVGIQQEEVNLLVETWAKSQQIRGKTASLAQLCKWWGEGVIDANEYLRRLLNLGWSRFDAEAIVYSCELDKAKKDTPKPPKPKPAPKPKPGGK